jgi:rhodanese-related sulfurtransferase
MKAAYFDELGRIAAALSSPKRLHALHLLFEGPKSIEELAAQLDESAANTAAHLKVLRQASLVSAERRGKYLVQNVTDPSVLRLFLALRDTTEQLSPAMRLLASETEAAADVTPQALGSLVDASRVVVVDLRPTDEYQAGHLPSARSLPFGEIHERAPELPMRKRILTYCRGKYCVKATQGAALLRQSGRRAEPLPFGVLEWRDAGLTLEAAGAR